MELKVHKFSKTSDYKVYYYNAMISFDRVHVFNGFRYKKNFVMEFNEITYNGEKYYVVMTFKRANRFYARIIDKDLKNAQDVIASKITRVSSKKYFIDELQDLKEEYISYLRNTYDKPEINHLPEITFDNNERYELLKRKLDETKQLLDLLIKKAKMD